MFIRAEHFFKKVIEINGIDTNMKVKMGALLLSRGNYREAKMYFDQVLDEDWKHLHVNLLYGILYKKIGEN